MSELRCRSDRWHHPDANGFYTLPPPLLVVLAVNAAGEPLALECPGCRTHHTLDGQPVGRAVDIVHLTTAGEFAQAAGRLIAAERHDTEGKHTGDITVKISSAPTADVRTLGWTDCGHDAWRNGLILDPFAGSGTTLAVATGHNRDAIGIDLDRRNLPLIRDRVGMFLDEGDAA